MSTFDAYQMLVDGVMTATDTIPLSPVAVDAYRIYRQPGATNWSARSHRSIHGAPVQADEAVQSVAGGVSCCVVADGLQTAIDRLAQLDVVVVVETQGTGKRGM